MILKTAIMHRASCAQVEVNAFRLALAPDSAPLADDYERAFKDATHASRGTVDGRAALPGRGGGGVRTGQRWRWSTGAGALVGIFHPLYIPLSPPIFVLTESKKYARRSGREKKGVDHIGLRKRACLVAIGSS